MTSVHGLPRGRFSQTIVRLELVSEPREVLVRTSVFSKPTEDLLNRNLWDGCRGSPCLINNEANPIHQEL